MWRYPFAFVLHLDAKIVISQRNQDPRDRAPRMAVNVRQAFLHHTENCSFHIA